MMIEYEFQVWQDDMPVAVGSASTLEEVQKEAAHYALVYSQDGDVEVKFFERKEIK